MRGATLLFFFFFLFLSSAELLDKQIQSFIRGVEQDLVTAGSDFVPLSRRRVHHEFKPMLAFIEQNMRDEGFSELVGNGVAFRLARHWTCIGNLADVSREIKLTDQRTISAVERCTNFDLQQGRKSECPVSGSLCRQLMDWRYRRVYAFLTQYRRKHLAETKTSFESTALSNPNVHLERGRSHERLHLALLLLSSMYDGAVIAQPIHPVPGWFGATAVFGILLVLLATALLAGIRISFWVDKRPLLSICLVLLVAVSLQIAVWTVRALGHQKIGFTPKVSAVPQVAVDLIDRFGEISYMIIYVLFVGIMLFALAESFFQSQRKLVHGLAIGLGVLTCIIGLYAICMAIYSATGVAPFVLDVSPVLVPIISVINAVACTATLAIVVRLIFKDKAAEANYYQMKQNAIIYLTASAILLFFFLVQLALSLVVAFGLKDSQDATSMRTVEPMFWKFVTPLQAVEATCNALVTVAVLGYVGLPIVALLKRQKDRDGASCQESESSTPLLKREEIPKVYQDI